MTEVTWLAVKGDTQVAVSKTHRFGTDAILLAHFSSPARGERVCELGTGCGAIALRLCAEGAPQTVHGVDLSTEAIALAKRSAEAFQGSPTPTFAVADWNRPETISAAGSFSRVVCNPPYFPPDSGLTSRDEAVRLARHEQADTLSSVCRAAAWLLKYGGRFCLCHRPERLAAVLSELTAHGLEPKRLQAVQQKPSTPPWLFLVEARKGGKAGLQWEAPFTLCNEDGTPSAAYQEMYGSEE